ncbi:IS66 family transposase [Roseomonas mucosa]|uniref:IS66 family transposase n=1 Tax=Roseomonas mucosa TaxID=207340 RepID=UPI00123949E2|nr:IS66 family transposase [Roseomonas mucosa]QET91590.1 IS66 family transposase [Roseomonas mucosa]
MQVPLDALPDDVEMLHRLVRDMADVVESKSSALDESRTEIARLRQIIRELQRTRFGRSAEHLDPGQLALALEAAEADLANAETAQPAPVPPPASCALPPRPHRTVLPAHLPRLESAVPVPHQCCPDCGGALRDAGESVAEMLDWVPAQVRVLRIRRPKCACRACGTLHQAPAPERILAKGLATPALVAHVLVSRYCDHLPLHRQSRILARHGAPIARSTLCDWVGQACWWLEPLHARLMTHVLAGERVFADDTPLPVLQPGKGRTQTGRLWAYARDDRPWGGETPPAVAFRYEPDRKAVRPVEHLRGYRGILQVDGYGGFEALGEGGRMTLAACWAHWRRRFYDLHLAGSPIASEALVRIAELYEVEARIRGQPPQERQAARQAGSRSMAEALRSWLEARLAQLPNRSRLAEAIRYGLGRWTGLTRFLDDGRVDLDTNPVERAIRPVALGRKNSLFAGSEGGAGRWAIVASLVETARLNGVEPYAWLRGTLTRMVEGHPRNRIDELMPWKAEPSHG